MRSVNSEHLRHSLATWRRTNSNSAIWFAVIDTKANDVVGYGAPAKGNTLLGYLEMGPEDIDYICDRSPLNKDAIRQVRIFRSSIP